MLLETSEIELNNNEGFKQIKNLLPGDVLKNGFIVRKVIRETLSSPRICIRLLENLIIDQDHYIATCMLFDCPDWIRAHTIRFPYLVWVDRGTIMYSLELENSTWFSVNQIYVQASCTFQSKL